MKKFFKKLTIILFNSFKWVFKSLLWICVESMRKTHSKKRYLIPFYTIILFFLTVFFTIKFSGDASYSKVLDNKRVNDITTLNEVQVGKIINPTSNDEIKKAIQATTGPISIGGGKFSMGGQTSFENSLHLDMRSFNKVIAIDENKRQVRVQSGITWRNLQLYIDKYDLSVKIMQTYANFTVGGSISVNCHGRYIGHGPIVSSVVELQLITANGELIICNREENSDLFFAAIGGYGGIGVIAEVTLQLVENKKVKRQTNRVTVEDYNQFFESKIKSDSNVVFQNGNLFPPEYNTVNNVSWIVTEDKLTDTTRVIPEDYNYWLEPILVEIVSWGNLGKWLRQAFIEDWVLSEEKVVMRNNEASYDVKELEPSSRKYNTYVLQEYFIPVNNLKSFIPKMKRIYEKHNVNIINVSIRHAYPDTNTYLSWAEEEVFAFVVYYKQGVDQKAKEIVRDWTVEMTEAIINENGKWYLPYQPHATVKQFEQAYTKSNKYFEIKNSIDSTHRFTNHLLDKYNPYTRSIISQKKKELKGYYRAEEQTFMTVPEWYLVFNPVEYATYLEEGNNPSKFPFFASIDEYWKLYDRSSVLTSIAYPVNKEYKEMLDVIGVSVTMEYIFKSFYENTLGSLFSLLAEEEISNKEKTIIKAQRAYADFVFNTAWYEFNFLQWIGKVWGATENGKGSFIRSWERTIFFTLEFTFKAIYGQLIEWAAKASYETPVTDIYLTISTEEEMPIVDGVKVIAQENDQYIIAIKRWGEFTETIVPLCKKKISILDISGNDEIVISVIGTSEQLSSKRGVDLLYTSEFVISDKKRLVYKVNVAQLPSMINSCTAKGLEVEHIYDY